MIEYIQTVLITRGVSGDAVVNFSNIIAAVVILLCSGFVYLIAKKILLLVLKMFVTKSKAKWDDILLENKVFDQAIRIIPGLVIYASAPVFPVYQNWIERIAYCYVIFVFLIALSRIIDSIDDIYKSFEVAKARPIKGYLQVLKILAYCIGIIAIIAVLIDRSPLLLLSGIGAATAVLLLIFQNSILGLVASIQLTSNKMVQIGDWIEMSKYGADGFVQEISLHTVKVQNWDKTITTIPTYTLISDSFKNWKGMQESGARRIKRSIFIDITSVKFCDEDMLQRYSKIQYINKYIEDKLEEIQTYNTDHQVDSASVVNGRRLTNIGTFRAYIEYYLINNPMIRKDMLCVVRQLAPTEKGLPIEIYAFANTTAFAVYEDIQSDLFDHVMAIIPEFDLRIFQGPTGYDLRNVTAR